MSREILFRGKRTDNGEWVEGYFIKGPYGESYIVVPSDAEKEAFGGVEYIRIKPSTVCQYTGLTDRNGVKIFEGDILIDAQKKLCLVTWGENIAGFKTARTGVLSAAANSTTLEDYKVVGNRWDNPDLLVTAAQHADQDVLALAT